MPGYSNTPLIKKLGLKEKSIACIVNAPPDYFTWIYPLPEKIVFKSKLIGQLDFIHLFVTNRESFQSAYLNAKSCLVNNGMLWVSWPKKSSKIDTDLDENTIREFGLQNGLVDVKVCAVSEIWSGLKFVVRLKDRK
jgi:hypothetical protein